MKARVHVMLKDGVLDPQGEAVKHALHGMGFDGVGGVRQGKVIELDLEDGTGEDHWSGFRPDNIKRVARASALL